MPKEIYSGFDKIGKQSSDIVEKCSKELKTFLDSPNSFMTVDFKSLDNLIAGIPKKPGVYFFRAKFPESVYGNEEFIDNFDQIWSSRKVTVSSFYKVKAEKCLQKYNVESDWIPFYLGKRINLHNRVKEHLKEPYSDGTYALRLSDFQSENSEIQFELAVAPIDVPKDQFFLIELIESKIREYYAPIIGKQ